MSSSTRTLATFMGAAAACVAVREGASAFLAPNVVIPEELGVSAPALRGATAEPSTSSSSMPLTALSVVVVGASAMKMSSRRRATQSRAQAVVRQAGSGVKAVNARQLVQKLFLEGGSQKMFGINCWYESPEVFLNGQQKVYQYWKERPTRDIERIDDGVTKCGCTWKQLDGRRGVSFIRFNSEGEVMFIREVPEPPGWSKFKENNLSSLRPLLGFMQTAANFFNIGAELYEVEDKVQPPPRYGLAFPKTRKASDVATYLWEEAQYSEGDAVDRIVAEFAEDIVYEDLTYVDEKWPQGIEALTKFQEEAKKNQPKNLVFVLDEVSDGVKACTVLWHVEYLSKKSPRGVTYYEFNDAGKVKYARWSYQLDF